MAIEPEFESFYAASHDRLVGQLFALLGDLHEAEDVVQEVFARASFRWSSICRYDAPEAWVRASRSTGPPATCGKRGANSDHWHAWARRPTYRPSQPIGWTSIVPWAASGSGAAGCSSSTTLRAFLSTRWDGSCGFRPGPSRAAWPGRGRRWRGSSA
jgi:hypothetical protein